MPVLGALGHPHENEASMNVRRFNVSLLNVCQYSTQVCAGRRCDVIAWTRLESGLSCAELHLCPCMQTAVTMHRANMLYESCQKKPPSIKSSADQGASRTSESTGSKSSDCDSSDAPSLIV